MTELKLLNETLPEPLWPTDVKSVVEFLYGTPPLTETQLRAKIRLFQHLPLTPLEDHSSQWDEKGCHKRCIMVLKSGAFIKDYTKCRMFKEFPDGHVEMTMLPPNLHKKLDITMPYYPKDVELLFVSVDEQGNILVKPDSE